jgi:sugar lactone lactonase YvrE
MTKMIVTFLLFTAVHAHAQKAEVAFKIPEKDIIPEGIAWDPTGKNFYIGSIQKNKILKITQDGIVTDFVKTNQDNIRQVLGMRVDNEGRLWACNNSPEQDTVSKISSVHVYDLKTGKLQKAFTLNDGTKHLFNDIHFTSSGDAYVTDSDGGAIYMIRKGSNDIQEFLKLGTLRYPNGITSTKDEKKLIVSTGSGLGIVSVDLQTQKVEQIPHEKFFIIGADGLYR